MRTSNSKAAPPCCQCCCWRIGTGKRCPRAAVELTQGPDHTWASECPDVALEQVYHRVIRCLGHKKVASNQVSLDSTSYCPMPGSHASSSSPGNCLICRLCTTCSAAPAACRSWESRALRRSFTCTLGRELKLMMTPSFGASSCSG